MDRNVVRIDKDCFVHLKEIIKEAEEKNAKEIAFYEYITSSEDKVSCVIVTDKDNIHISIASYDD